MNAHRLHTPFQPPSSRTHPDTERNTPNYEINRKAVQASNMKGLLFSALLSAIGYLSESFRSLAASDPLLRRSNAKRLQRLTRVQVLLYSEEEQLTHRHRDTQTQRHTDAQTHRHTRTIPCDVSLADSS